MFKQIAIVGVGLIGGSIGMAARKKRLASEVIGIGRRVSSLKKALAKGAIDTATLDLRDGLSQADLIIIAVPIEKVMPKIREAAHYAKEGAIIIDVNSTKEKIVAFAQKIIPKKASFVGTHPMAGSEETGVMFADGSLFKDRVCVITPVKNTNRQSLAKIKSFWKALGAKIEIMQPGVHDKAVSNISHLPHILSYNLCNSVDIADLKIAGTGFKDTTRIAKSNPFMWLEIFISNKEHLLKSVSIFQKNLSALMADIKSNRRKQILKKLNAAKRKRDKI